MGALDVGEAAMSSKSEVPGGARRSTEESSRMKRPMVKAMRSVGEWRETLEVSELCRGRSWCGGEVIEERESGGCSSSFESTSPVEMHAFACGGEEITERLEDKHFHRRRESGRKSRREAPKLSPSTLSLFSLPPATFLSPKMTTITWKLQGAAHVAARDARIPAELRLPQDLIQSLAQDRVVDWLSLDSLLTPRERDIITSSSSKILEKVASSDWSAVEVTKVGDSLLFASSASSMLRLILGLHLQTLSRHSAFEQLSLINSPTA